MHDREVLTLSEAATLIRTSNKTLGEMARSGKVPAQKVGREWRFLRSALETWLSGSRSPVVEASEAKSNSDVKEPEFQYEMRIAGFRDTAFSDNHRRRLHRWVPWIAGFSSSFVTGVLDQVNGDGRTLQVLDPFAGVGTTLVEAIRGGHNAVGFEINPYAALASKAKSEVAHYDASLLATAIERFDDYVDERLWLETPPSSVPPQFFRSRVPFFSPDVEAQALLCLDFIQDETVGWIKELFQLAFGSVMVSFSNYSYEPSLGTRAAAGKPNVEQADVPGIVKRKLFDIYEDIIFFQSEMAERKGSQSAVVHPMSYMDHADAVPSHSVDVVITSPPYLNNYHYIRNTRPQLFWLGLVDHPSELKSIERKSFGQFWQTVRAGPDVNLIADMPHLDALIQELRSRYMEKGPYGGPGWANYAASYFNDCQRFCEVTRPLMKSGGTLVVVIGNNILQGIEFQTDRLFAEIAEREGFEIIDLHEVRTKRTGNSVVNSSVRVGTVTRRTRLYETAIELRAP